MLEGLKRKTKELRSSKTYAEFKFDKGIAFQSIYPAGINVRSIIEI